MPAPIIGAGIAAAATVGGAVITSKANKKAVNQATDAQAQAAREQIAFQREARAENTANLSPWMQRGNIAGDTINALLGLGGATVAPAQRVPQGALTVPYQGPNPDSTGAMGVPGAFRFNNGDYTIRPDMMPNEYWQGVLRGQAPQPAPQPAAPTAAQPQERTPQQAANAAYNIFKKSTGYQTRLEQGIGALSANYFGGGVGQSGAAMKAAIRYGQNFASDEFGRYLGYLGNQQGVGFAGASALAGVSQGFADRMSDISQNGANLAAQAAVARAQNNGALWSGIAGAAGNLAGALSSYGTPAPAPAAASTQPGFGTILPSYAWAN